MGLLIRSWDEMKRDFKRGIAVLTGRAAIDDAITAHMNEWSGQEWFKNTDLALAHFERELGRARRFGNDSLFFGIGASATEPTESATLSHSWSWKGSRAEWWATGRDEAQQFMHSIRGGAVLLYRIF